MAQGSLICIGTGDGWPSADRNHAAFLYRIGKVSFLIDCGEPVSARFCANGWGPDLVDFILLSHLHFDHVGGLFMLIQGFWVEGRTKDLVVRVPSTGVGPLRQVFDAACFFDELLHFRLQFQALRMAEPVQMPGVQVTPFPTTHLAGFRRAFPGKPAGLFDAFSFLIESDGLRVAHSADIGAAADLEPLLEKPLDLLVCELAHAAPEELFARLQGRNIGRIVFVHLARECRQRLTEISALAREWLSSIEVSFAEDGEEVSV